MIKNQSIKGYSLGFFVDNTFQYFLIKYLSFLHFRPIINVMAWFMIYSLQYTNKQALVEEKTTTARLCSNQFQLCPSYFSNEYQRFQFYAVNSDITKKKQVLHFTFLLCLQIKIFYNSIYNIFY